MKVIDKYIIKQFLITFFFAIFLLSAIAVVIDITEKIDNFIDNKATLKVVIFDYYINFIPYIALMLAPIFVFISVVYFTSKLTSDTEIICMLNGGISFYRLLIPYIFTATLLASGFAYYNHYLLPKSNQKRIKFEETYSTKRDQMTYEQNYHFQVGKDTLIYTMSFDKFNLSGSNFTLETFKNDTQNYKIIAQNIQWDTIKKYWKLSSYKIIKNKGKYDDVITGADTILKASFTPKEYNKQVWDKELMTTTELNKFIKDQKQKGAENLSFYEIEKHKRTSVPFSTIILTLIAVAMTTKKVRNGMGLYIVAGMLISGAYIIIQQFSSVFATKGNLDPFLGAWIPNILFGIVALLLLFRAPK